MIVTEVKLMNEKISIEAFSAALEELSQESPNGGGSAQEIEPAFDLATGLADLSTNQQNQL